jgi:hypothetical protein
MKRIHLPRELELKIPADFLPGFSLPGLSKFEKILEVYPYYLQDLIEAYEVKGLDGAWEIVVEAERRLGERRMLAYRAYCPFGKIPPRFKAKVGALVDCYEWRYYSTKRVERYEYLGQEGSIIEFSWHKHAGDSPQEYNFVMVFIEREVEE